MIDLIIYYFFSFRKLMIQQKSPQKAKKNIIMEDQSKLKKEVDPLKQDIVQNFVKINGDKSNKLHQKISFLGKGGFAECFLTQQRDTLRKAATKVIPKKMLDSHRTKIRLANEIKLHKSLRNEYVVQFYSNFEDDENVYINLQVCENGSINDILRGRYTFTTPQVQSFVYGVCHGLKYLHSRNIIHRDLKLGNIFLNSDFKVKIGDFGLACKLQFSRQFKRTVCGTPNYIAPEVLQGKGYHFEIDVWALGVMIYTLYFTIPPFETEEPHTTYQKIRKGDYQFPKYYQAPPEAIDLIKKILVSDPMKRLTLDQILESPFMKLGNSIPLGLPAVAGKRPPTRKQLANWPSVKKNVEEQKSSLNNTVLGFLGITKKTQKNLPKTIPIQDLQLKKRDSFCKQKNQNESGLVYCKVVEQVENQLMYFFLNNGNYGIYDPKLLVAFTCQLKDSTEKVNEKNEKNNQLVKKSSMNDSGSIKQQQIQLNECLHKVVLGIKHKQLLQAKMQVCIRSGVQKQISVTKVNVYKDIIMVRLSNRSIQIIYKQKDGFFINSDRKNIHYFYAFAELDQGKQVDIQSLLHSGSQHKQNKLNGSTQFSICSIFKSKKNQKHYLTMRKLSYLKGILMETMNRNARKST